VIEETHDLSSFSCSIETGTHCALLSVIESEDMKVHVVSNQKNFRSKFMLGYAVTFLIIALIAGALGFGLVGGMAYGAAKIFFFVFLVLAVLSLFSGRRINTN